MSNIAFRRAVLLLLKSTMSTVIFFTAETHLKLPGILRFRAFRALAHEKILPNRRTLNSRFFYSLAQFDIAWSIGYFQYGL